MPTFTPVEDDPFATPDPASTVARAPKLEAVDYDPFAQTAPAPAAKPMAPAAGPFPAVGPGGKATVPQNTMLPESPPGFRAPAPSSAPASDIDPGLLAESYGDTVKGWHSTKRGAFLTGYMTGVYDDVDNIATHLAASKDIEAMYPSSPQNRKANEELERIKDSGAGGILPSLGVYAKNPRLAASTALQSLPSMLSSLVTVPVGAIGGGLVAGPPGAAAGGVLGIGVGSAAADFGNAFEEYARDKWKPQDAAQWKAILTDEAKTREAGNYAALHAGMVGLFDAAGSKIGGKVGAKIVGDRIANTPGRLAATAVAGAPASAAVGASGEAAGQLAAGGKISDPGGVAGEFAGSIVTDVASAGTEPTIKALNVGGERPRPPTPEDVAAAQMAMEQPRPEEISGHMSVVTKADESFYSPARRFIEEKGQGVATSDQWRNTLKNAAGVKDEELRDTGLDQFLAENPKPTKKQMLDFLDENAIRMEVTERDTGVTPDPGNWNVPGLQRPDAQFEQHTLPGERTGYTELTFHMPTRNVEGDNTQQDFVGGHYKEPNVIAHARVTERQDVNGTPVALIEEIQSDWHQGGRVEGYRNPTVIAAMEQRQNELRQQAAPIYAKIPDVPGMSLWGQALKARDAGLITTEEFNKIDELEVAPQEIETEKNLVPTGPFKQSWPELAFKRMLRWATDQGYRRVAWVDSREQMRRYPEADPESSKRDEGMQHFYDKVIPSIAKKWAKKLGGTVGTTEVPSPQHKFEVKTVGRNLFQIWERNTNTLMEDFTNLQEALNYADELKAKSPVSVSKVQYIDLPQAGVDAIQRGLPMYSLMSEESKKPKRPGATLDELAGPAKTSGPDMLGLDYVKPLDELVKAFKLPLDVKLILHKGKTMGIRRANGRVTRINNALGVAEGWGGKTNGYIHIALGRHSNAAEVWATITHELGHIIMDHKFNTAPETTRIAVKAAYDEWKAKTPANVNMKQMILTRDNAAVAFFNMRNFDPHSRLDTRSPSQRQYWVSFEEWFAEQVARWGTSQEPAFTTVEKFFKGLGQLLRTVFKAASQKFGLSFEPNKAMANWLNSFHTDAAPFAQDTIIQTDVDTTANNQRHMEPEEKAVEQQPETGPAREGIDKLFGGRPPGEVKQAAAYADKFNKFYKWALGIHQVADRNKHIQPLQEYTETIAVAQLTKQQVMIRAQEILKAWNRLGETQADNLTAFIDDIQNMVYRTPDEVARKVARTPTLAEVQTLASKHNVSQQGLGVFRQITESFQEHLTRYEAVLVNEAKKITDPAKQAARLKAISRQILALRSKPYFPAMRFGDYTVTVRDAANKVIHFETFDNRRTAAKAGEAIQAQGVAHDRIQLGVLDKQVKPLMGVPTQLLDLMANKLQMSTKQRDALEQLKFELSPAQSFKHRFQHKRRVVGYSQDFRRAYAAYFFHGANHLMKAMYADRLRALAKDTKAEVQAQYDATTRHEIVAFMNDHLENWLDPKSDWAAIRSIAFLWSLAYSPAAAAQNLTQTLMTTLPFLAHQFGDVRAIAAIAKTGADFQTWYRKGTLEKHTDFELRAIGRGIQDGIINEAMAPELAGYAEGGTLGKGFGGNELERAITTFNQWGAKMFETAEQINRRLVFRSTLKLAQAYPDVKYVKDSVVKHKLHYDQLRQEGWTEQEAAAYVSARDATITTQFQYGREYAPRMFRGKARAIFVFKTFIQSYVMFLSNYPGAAVRSLLIMGTLGGLMGLPGGDDLRELLKAIGWQMFGKDFDLDREARRMIINMFGQTETSREFADMILHGTARQGYGIPAFMDMLGGTVGVDIPMPVFDRSASISAGTLLPVELGKLFGPPTQSQDAVIAAQAQKASGAVFGAGFNIYKALTNSKIDANDTKRWERAVPRALGNLAKAYRVGTEGKERTSTGSTLVSYDVRDPQQLFEVMGIAAGYTPYRQSLQWNRVMAGQEVTKLWDIQRTGLMKQMGNAVLGHDQKEIDKVRTAIQKFNTNLPTEARGKAITSDTLRASLGTQARTRAAQEAELSVKKSDIPILKEVQKLYPESQRTTVRKVRALPQ